MRLRTSVCKGHLAISAGEIRGRPLTGGLQFGAAALALFAGSSRNEKILIPISGLHTAIWFWWTAIPFGPPSMALASFVLLKSVFDATVFLQQGEFWRDFENDRIDRHTAIKSHRRENLVRYQSPMLLPGQQSLARHQFFQERMFRLMTTC
jgi:hypothetical protein